MFQQLFLLMHLARQHMDHTNKSHVILGSKTTMNADCEGQVRQPAVSNYKSQKERKTEFNTTVLHPCCIHGLTLRELPAAASLPSQRPTADIYRIIRRRSQHKRCVAASSVAGKLRGPKANDNAACGSLWTRQQGDLASRAVQLHRQTQGACSNQIC